MPTGAPPETSAIPPQGVAPPRSGRPKVLVIGAGSSGLITLRALCQRGLNATAVESSDYVGGLWVYRPDDPRCRAYESLCINTSTRQMELTGFPMPTEFGDFPSHRVVAEYFERFANEFRLREKIAFGTTVQSVRASALGGYEVLVSGPEGERQETFDAVVVATGHHGAALVPECAKTFNGNWIHSSQYRTPESPLPVAGKRVLVVGFGNSAVDIASDIAQRGNPASVLLAVRRGAWVLPKYLRGKPIDGKAVIPLWLPPKLRRRLVTTLFRLIHGDMESFGLPRPDHLIGEAHPTISDTLPALVANGSIKIRRGLKGFEGSQALFTDGASDEVDCVVFCTGYRTEFPFLSKDEVEVDNNTVPLYLRVFHPKRRRLFFIGLAQPLGAIFPLAEAQAELVAEHLLGEHSLPETAELERAITRERKELAARYVPSPRHSMQVDPELYIGALRRELAEGRRRAKKNVGTSFPLAKDSP